MRGHFSLPSPFVHVHYFSAVDGQLSVRVDSHTEQTRVCLKKSMFAIIPR